MKCLHNICTCQEWEAAPLQTLLSVVLQGDTGTIIREELHDAYASVRETWSDGMIFWWQQCTCLPFYVYTASSPEIDKSNDITVNDTNTQVELKM